MVALTWWRPLHKADIDDMSLFSPFSLTTLPASIRQQHRFAEEPLKGIHFNIVGLEQDGIRAYLALAD